MQDFINDSRLNVIQDSRLDVHDTSFQDLDSAVHNLTGFLVPLVCELDAPSKPHDILFDGLTPTYSVSFLSPPEHASVASEDSNVVSFRSSFDVSVSDVFATQSFVELHDTVYSLGVPIF